MNKITRLTAIAIAVASVCTSVLAEQISDDEAALRFRLKNELRRADKPSAGTGKNIYAWVQGGLVDFNSGYYSQFIGVE
ncbi:glucuronide uptake porin UidC, partial [Enterobacter hormaechei]